ncbi:MAG: NHL repeat-containing protein, partial [Oligoflexales bacterium]|nr:NHL repeat-containing protein [Oligoflexales bacterium]
MITAILFLSSCGRYETKASRKKSTRMNLGSIATMAKSLTSSLGSCPSGQVSGNIGETNFIIFQASGEWGSVTIVSDQGNTRIINNGADEAVVTGSSVDLKVPEGPTTIKAIAARDLVMPVLNEKGFEMFSGEKTVAVEGEEMTAEVPLAYGGFSHMLKIYVKFPSTVSGTMTMLDEPTGIEMIPGNPNAANAFGGNTMELDFPAGRGFSILAGGSKVLSLPAADKMYTMTTAELAGYGVTTIVSQTATYYEGGCFTTPDAYIIGVNGATVNASDDDDGDGYSNQVEVNYLTNPFNKYNYPGSYTGTSTWYSQPKQSYGWVGAGNSNYGWTADMTPASGTGFGYFSSPQGIAVDSNSYIYVADMNNQRVAKLSGGGLFVGWIGGGYEGWISSNTAAQSSNTPNKYFNGPDDIATDDTYIYVTNSSANSISRWTTGGTFSAWIGAGVGTWTNSYTAILAASTAINFFNAPKGIAYSSGYLYIADSGNNRVVRLNASSGATAGWIGGGQTSTGWNQNVFSNSGSSSDGYFNSPADVALSSQGDVLVADFNNHRVSHWSSAGTWVGWYGRNNLSSGSFHYNGASGTGTS